MWEGGGIPVDCAQSNFSSLYQKSQKSLPWEGLAPQPPSHTHPPLSRNARSTLGHFAPSLSYLPLFSNISCLIPDTFTFTKIQGFSPTFLICKEVPNGYVITTSQYYPPPPPQKKDTYKWNHTQLKCWLTALNSSAGSTCTCFCSLYDKITKRFTSCKLTCPWRIVSFESKSFSQKVMMH